MTHSEPRLPDRRPGRRTTSLALVLVCTLLGSTAVATTLTVGGRTQDLSNATPVEKYRAEALAAVEKSGQPAASVGSAAAEEDGELRNLEHVYNYDFQANDAEGRQFSAKDQGTDIEFYSPTVPALDADGQPVLGADGTPVTEVRDYAIVGSYDRGAFIFDITDPENPSYVTQIVCRQRQNDIQIRQFGERWLVMLSNDRSGTLCAGEEFGGRDFDSTAPTVPTNSKNSNGGVAVFDVTDPRTPEVMYNVRVSDGVHNWTWHPTEPVAWVSTGDLPGGLDHLPIIDFTNVDEPELISDGQVEGGPHDITFSADGTKGYIASENNVRVYDTTDPRAPTLLYRGPTIASYVHGSDPTPDGRTLLVTDESLVLGGFFASRTAACPGGGITLFDATSTPLKPISYLLADIQGQTPDARACTAHVGDFTPDSKIYSTGWYLGGVRMFDISNPAAPSEVASAMMPRSEVWSAKMHKGQYVFTGDLGRGFDVYRVTGDVEPGTPPVGPGTGSPAPQSDAKASNASATSTGEGRAPGRG